MAKEVIMPQLGLTMTEGKIVRWLKSEGDRVKKGEIIVEIMSDKANFELEAPAEGVLLQILAGEGTTVPIAEVIAYIGEPGEKVPEEGRTTKPESVAAEETEQAHPDRYAQQDAYQEEKQGKRLFISPRAKKAAREKGIPLQELSGIQGSGPKGRIVEKDVLSWLETAKVKATPLAKKAAQEEGIDLQGMEGTGVGGKIVRADVQAAAESQLSTEDMTEEQVLPLEGIRKATAERMSYSAQTKPHVTLTTEVDMTETVNIRKQLNENSGSSKISFTDILVKVCAAALKKHPDINAVFGEKEIRLLGHINIGVATATDNGLLVPVIKDAVNKNLKQISQELKEKVTKARSGKLSLADMSEGTFTISNLGTFDIDAFTPIINPPESAILGVGRLVKKPAVHKDNIEVRSMMYLSLSFDHRVLDGAPAAEFLKTVKSYLESPYKLLLEI